MSERFAFDHRPDPEIGRIVRAALSAEEEEEFVQRVLAAAPLFAKEATWWEEMTDWVRPGLAAAGLLAAAAVVWFVVTVGDADGASTLGDPLVAAGEGAAVPAYLVSAEEPDVNAMMALASEYE